jgi:hypothetical protein
VARHIGLSAHSAGGVAPWLALDVVANDVAVLPGPGSSPREVRLRQGVLDTNIEALFTAPDAASVNVAEVMAASPGPEEWIRLERAEHPIAASALRAGMIVLARSDERGPGTGRSGWWRIDPRTGTALGFTAQGWGGSGTETATTTKLTGVNSMRLVARLFITLLCVAGVLIKSTIQGMSRRMATPGYSPDASGDQGPGSYFGYALCVAGGFLSGYGTYLGGATGSRYSLAGDLVSLVMSFWSVAATYQALLDMLHV